MAAPQRRLPGAARPDPESLYTRAGLDDRVELPQQLAVGCVERHQHPAAGARAVGAGEVDSAFSLDKVVHEVRQTALDLAAKAVAVAERA